MYMLGWSSIFAGNKYGNKTYPPSEDMEVSLCDVEDDRILDWLEDTIKEEDFIKMKEYGVQLLRLPTGYWNWVDLGNLTPNGPPETVQRFRNLQAVKPVQYQMYIDRIFEFADKESLAK